MAWTQFMDMHSGGSLKEKAQYIYIEAPEAEAVVIFYNRFGHNPNRITCMCCGNDYSITESATLEEATGYERGRYYNEKTHSYEDKPDTDRYRSSYQSLEQYLKGGSIFIRQDEIKPEERTGKVPQQGFVWVG